MIKKPPLKVLFFGNPGYGDDFLVKLLELKEVKIVGVFKKSDNIFFNILNILKLNLFHKKKNFFKRFLSLDKIKNFFLNLSSQKNSADKFTNIDKICEENNIKVFDPSKYFNKKYRNILHNLNIDVLLVATYSYLIPEHVIKISKYCSVNFHPSLLPRYRGSNPEFCSIFYGENQTGITFHILNKKFDSGDIIMQREIRLSEEETTISLKKKLSKLGTESLKEFFSLIREQIINNSNLVLKKQEPTLVSYCSLPNKYDFLSCELTIEEVKNRLRAFDGLEKRPYIKYKNKKIFILSHKENEGFPYNFSNGIIFFNKIIYNGQIYDQKNMDWLRG